MADDAAHLASTDTVSGAMRRLPLRFVDAALEARYREEQDPRVVPVFRIGIVLGGLLMLVPTIVLPAFAPPSLRVDPRVIAAFLAFALSVVVFGMVFSYSAQLRRWPQLGIAAICVLFAPCTVNLLRALPPDFVVHRGFLFLGLHLFTIHSLLRLRFGPAAVAGTLAIPAYAVPMVLSGLLTPVQLAPHVFWLFMIHAWGMLISWRLDAGSRREFAARLALDRERARSEALLLNILPQPIAQRLKVSPQRIADRRDEVTVLFADLVGFTPLAARMEPEQLVGLLDDVISRFDALAREHGLEKIKTIGDAYLAVAGLPEPIADHAQRAARMALAMVGEVEAVNARSGEQLRLRLGLHSGPVVAGVIGRTKFSYDLWGDTVNTASRMESSGVPGRAHCSATTAALLAGALRLEPRGVIEVKGKGAMETFLLAP